MISFSNATAVQEVDEYGDSINTTLCLFPGTTQTYMDCCTDSAIKTCNFLQIMFWASFVLYAGLFYYIVGKKPWIKHHGLYINVFGFQMLVLFCKSLNLTL
jgi:hypothetical protein